MALGGLVPGEDMDQLGFCNGLKSGWCEFDRLPCTRWLIGWFLRAAAIYRRLIFVA